MLGACCLLGTGFTILSLLNIIYTNMVEFAFANESNMVAVLISFAG